jgi:hypothetical protein
MTQARFYSASSPYLTAGEQHGAKAGLGKGGGPREDAVGVVDLDDIDRVMV